MKRKILVCLLALCMLLAMIPVLGLSVAAADADTVVATVKKDDKVILETDSFTNALTRAKTNENATLVLEADLEITAGFDIGGNYTLDLNGHSIKAHTPLITTKDTVVIIDSSADKSGNITGIDCPALELQTGNALLKSGTFTSTNGKYAVAVLGEGILYLSETPVIAKTVYMKNPETVVGNDGAETDPVSYEGEKVSVYFGQETFEEGVVLINGADGNFEIVARGMYAAQSSGNTLTFSQVGTYANYVMLGIAALVVVLLLSAILYMVSVKRKIKKLSAVAFPSFATIMASLGSTQKILAIVALAALVATIVFFFASIGSSKKKLKKAKAAAAEKAKAAEEEKAKAAEAPAEEPAAEEEAEDEADEPKQRAPITLISTPVVDADGKTTSYSNYKKSFLARIVLAPDDVQERYNALKNALLSYKKVNARTSWSYESFKSGRKQLAKFAIRGKTLCLFLAMDPGPLMADSKYNVSDESASKKFETVPCRLRLTSKRSVKWGLELIAKMAEIEELAANPKYKEVNYIPEAKSDEEMLAMGLIKEIS